MVINNSLILQWVKSTTKTSESTGAISFTLNLPITLNKVLSGVSQVQEINSNDWFHQHFVCSTSKITFSGYCVNGAGYLARPSAIIIGI